MDEVTKVYEGGDLIQDADELARIETNYENKLTAMGEEGEMLKNLRKPFCKTQVMEGIVAL